MGEISTQGMKIGKFTISSISRSGKNIQGFDTRKKYMIGRDTGDKVITRQYNVFDAEELESAIQHVWDSLVIQNLIWRGGVRLRIRDFEILWEVLDGYDREDFLKWAEKLIESKKQGK